jgi:uncharacterized membrane protein (DUF485 family)
MKGSELIQHESLNENDYKKVVESEEFQSLLRTKKKFIVPISIFFFCFYLALPLLTSYTKILHTPAIGSITWAWLFAFAQFIMTWGLCILYSKKAVSFDEKSDKILQKLEQGGSHK